MNWFRSHSIKANLSGQMLDSESGTSQFHYNVGRYIVKVDEAILGSEPENAVTYTTGDHRDRNTPVRVEVVDRRVTIDVDDLAELALERCEPTEIAESLWRHKEVRDAFVDLMAKSLDSWSDTESGWDESREALLRRMNVGLLSRRINKFARVLQSAEYYERKYWELYHGHEWANSGRAERPEYLPKVSFSEEGYGSKKVFVHDDPEHKIGSKNWTETRDHWRAQLIRLVADDLPEFDSAK